MPFYVTLKNYGHVPAMQVDFIHENKNIWETITQDEEEEEEEEEKGKGKGRALYRLETGFFEVSRGLGATQSEIDDVIIQVKAFLI